MSVSYIQTTFQLECVTQKLYHQILLVSEHDKKAGWISPNQPASITQVCDIKVSSSPYVIAMYPCLYADSTLLLGWVLMQTGTTLVEPLPQSLVSKNSRIMLRVISIISSVENHIHLLKRKRI